MVDVRPVDVERNVSAFDLTLVVEPVGDGVVVRVRYRTDMFEPWRMERMLEHFQTLLAGALADPTAPIARLPLLGESERRQLLVEWNDTYVDYGPADTIHRLFEARARETPEAVAVVLEDATLSYRQLDERANTLAILLRSLGVTREVLVGICAERSLEMVIALIAVLKADGAYVPLDPDSPPERLAFMLDDTGVRVVLVQEALAERIPASGARVVRMTTACADLAPAPDGPGSSATPDNLMYVIYTSGSTGRPKGVMLTHRGVFDRIAWMLAECGVTPADRLLQRAPFGFDVSVWEFFLPLISGSVLVLALPGGHADPAYLARAIARQRITLLGWVPSFLEVFLKKPRLEGMESLRYSLCGAEVMSRETERRYYERLPGWLYNIYGPTEITFHVTFWKCRPHHPWRTVPIGRPMANSQVYVLDAELQPVPVGVPGDLYVGGVGIARGYYNRPDLTAERFIPDPFLDEPGARLYKTGDLARFLPDGNIEFIGRLDDQVKLRGFRIELGEIEAALAGHPRVLQAAVVVRRDRPASPQLVAYVVPSGEPAPSPAELRAFVSGMLPDYMIPSTFVTAQSLPVTSSGKVDRRALPPPRSAGAGAPKLPEERRSATEQLLMDVWCDVLGSHELSAADDFFALGGSYIQASRMLSRIGASTGTRLSLAGFLESRTLASLAAILDAVGAS